MPVLLNGAGALVAISALPMLGGVIISEGVLATWLRRTAIVLAVALPAVFMLLTALIYLPRSDTAFFDFSVNYNAAQALYGHGISPYTIPGAYSFPFPTFYLYWLASIFGGASETSAWVVWWLANAVLWLLCIAVLWRSITPPTSPRMRDALIYVAVAIPAVTTLWQGQTALFILIGLVVIHWAVQESRSARFSWWTTVLAGAGLAWATLIKPQLALVGAGIAVWALLQARNGQREKAKQSFMILAVSVIVAGLLIGATLILTGGVTLDTYRQFLSQALPQVAQAGDPLAVNGSPAFAAAAFVLQMGGAATTSDIAADGITLLVLVGAVIWTWRRADRPLTEIAAGWGVWAMIAPRVTWTWYAAWCLPFFLLAVQESLRARNSKMRLILFIVTLGLLNLQVEQALVAFGTIVLLIALLWTSFHTRNDVSYG